MHSIDTETSHNEIVKIQTTSWQLRNSSNLVQSIGIDKAGVKSNRKLS